MAIVAADWSIDRVTGNIRYIGSDHGGSPDATYATVIEFHRWLQDLADDASYVGNDELDITDSTPSERSTDNIVTLNSPYNIDDNAAEHLYDGSIIQDNLNTYYDGIVNFGNADVQIQIIQNGAVLADDWWNFNGAGLNADAVAGISHRFMIKVRTGGADIDGRRLIGTCRRFNFTYSEFKINGTSRGNNVLALSDSTDLNNANTAATVSGWSGITNVNEGYTAIDVDNDTVDEYFYSEWDRSTFTINQLYERLKWLTRDGSASTLYGLNGELFRGITHSVAIGSGSGTWVEPESCSWPTGTGQLLAVDNTAGASTTALYIQVLTGVAPSSTQTITGNGGATGVASANAVERAVSRPFCGVSTGSALIGAYGLGVQYLDLSNSDILTALDGDPYQAPNLVTFSVFGLIAGQDRVLVGPEDGAGGLLYSQLGLLTTLSGATETAVVCTAPIPTDSPASGTIRVQLDSGLYRRVEYSSFTGSTFTIPSTDFSSDNATAGSPQPNIFISYIDKLAESLGSPSYDDSVTTETFTVVYNTARTLFVRVRDGGASPIKTFETTGSLGSGGGSATAIRTSDA